MKEFIRRALISLLVVFIGKTFDSLSRCDARPNSMAVHSIKTMYACEDNMMHLTCPHSSLSVKILSAKYGRVLSKSNICQPTSETQIVADCGENNVKANVVKLCFGKTDCSFNVDNRHLGAFCVNVYKYLYVIFNCVVKPTPDVPPSTTPMPTTPPIFVYTEGPTTNLTIGNSTNNHTYYTTKPNPSIITEEKIKEAPELTPDIRNPDMDVYNRDVFSRKNGAFSVLSSAHYSSGNILLALLVYVVFDVFVLRLK